MKRIATAILVLVLLVAVAVPAFAMREKMYVKKDCKAYQEPDKHSRVTMELHVGHDLTVTDYIDGFYECRYGWVQAKYLSDTCPHKWGSWHTVKEPTCTQKGKKEHTCKYCGEVRTESIEKLGHKWGKWKVTKEATCIKQGTRRRTCQRCGEVETERFYAEHEWGKWKMTKEPTCTAKGEKKRTCRVCDKVETRAIDMLPHDYEWKVIEEATDHSSGTRAQVCKVCGHTTKAQSYDPEGTLRRKDRGEEVRKMQQLLVEQGYLNNGGADGIFGGGTEKALMQYQKDRNLNPDGIGWPQTLKDLEHDFGPWETVKEMTRAEAGERVRVCRGCGFEQHETVEPGEVIEFGDRGENVRAIQQMLKQVGYDAGGFDGIYGKKMDAAFTKFDEAHSLTFQKGKVRPVDVDALVNAWLESSGTPLTKCGIDSAVNLVLSVTPSTDEMTDSDVTTYNWSLYNMGTEDCMFNALLLTFGDNPDFNRDDLTMVVDGVKLKAESANSVSGSFRAAKAWGEGNLNFAAAAVSDDTGAKWLSNVVTFEAVDESAHRTVAPLASDIDVNKLPDGVYPVAFNRGDVMKGASGTYMNAVHIFTEDWYDIADIDALKVGDTIVVDGESVEVKSIERGEDVLINGDVTLTNPEDTNGYRFCGDDDMSAYTELGVTTLQIDPSATYTDSSDIEADPVKTDYDGIVDAMLASDNDSFDQYNTTVRIESGKVVEIRRVYVP